jgi:lactoylglutathione lyase
MDPIRPGAFSISLAVADLAASRRFYETLGFEVAGGDADEHWLILRNGDAVIGLFEQMFDQNILTFNPGLTQQAEPTDDFTDVRDVQAALRAAGYEPVLATEPDGTGPAHVVVLDPDGNQVMVDQFVDRPGS